MKRFIPIPGDLIIVESSQWCALNDGERLRVCEHSDWMEIGEEIEVAPRHKVKTFWGPHSGPPNGIGPEHMSTSGGPFKSVRIDELEGLELIGEEVDSFWCWPTTQQSGEKERHISVAVWRVRVLRDSQSCDFLQTGLPILPEEPEPCKHPRHDSCLEAVLAISNGSIRLSCERCHRTDFDYISHLPTDWKGIHLHMIPPNGGWTHRGICPRCQIEMLEAVNPIIGQIIDRDCIVSTPCSEVVQHVISKLREGYKTYRSMPQSDRELMIEQIVRHHLGNLKQYIEVMSGYTRKEVDILAGVPSKMSGKEVIALMRQHRITIELLAFRLGTSMERVREIRQSGLQSALVVRDWIQAITGEDPGPIPNRCRIAKDAESIDCPFCGCPLMPGDLAYEYLGEVFCSTNCCRKSRGW